MIRATEKQHGGPYYEKGFTLIYYELSLSFFRNKPPPFNRWKRSSQKKCKYMHLLRK